MGKVDKLLKPWYAVNDDPMKYKPYSARESGADGNAHLSAYHKSQELNWLASMSKDTKRNMAQTKFMNRLITIVKEARKALYEDSPYGDVNSCKWFEQQVKAGLYDVFFVYGEWANGVLQTCDKTGIVCWYTNGEKRYTTIDIGDDYEPFLVERTLLDTGYVKPRLNDNRERLEEVLQHLAACAADCSGLSTWSISFRTAASEAKNGDLMKAVKLSETGGGMGSWYDTPVSGMKEIRLLNEQLFVERQYAMMYAVNCE